MGTWGALSADKFVGEVTNFLANNPYADEDGISSCTAVSMADSKSA